MPSRPLTPGHVRRGELVTRLDVEAIGLAKDQTGRRPAVARLALLVPPARADLVDQALETVGHRVPDRFGWPPIGLVPS